MYKQKTSMVKIFFTILDQYYGSKSPLWGNAFDTNLRNWPYTYNSGTWLHFDKHSKKLKNYCVKKSYDVVYLRRFSKVTFQLYERIRLKFFQSCKIPTQNVKLECWKKKLLASKMIKKVNWNMYFDMRMLFSFFMSTFHLNFQFSSYDVFDSSALRS